MMLIDIITLILIVAGFSLSYKLGEIQGINKRICLNKHEHKHKHHGKSKYQLPARRP